MAELTSKLVKQYNLNPCNEVNRLYNEAVATGYAPGSSCKVQFLGDARVGKTSLCKRLMGETFDPNEPETFGIDTKMCNVKQVDENWDEKISDDTEINDCISWYYKNKLGDSNKTSIVRTSQELINLAIGIILIATFECLLWLCAFANFPIGNRMRPLIWISCVIVLLKKDVALYLSVKGSSQTLFTMIVATNIVFTTEDVLPQFAKLIVTSLIALLQGIIAPCGTRMGQSVFLGWILIFIPSNSNPCFNEWILQNGVSKEFVLYYVMLGMLPATYPTNCSFVFQTATYLNNYLLNGKHKLTITSITLTVAIASLVLLPIFFELKTPFILFVLGLGSGICDKIGLSLGHRLMNSKYFIDNILSNVCIWYSISMLYSFLLVTISCGTTAFYEGDVIWNIFSGVLPLVIGEWQRNQLVDYSLKVSDVARRVEESIESTMPLKLSLWDFAGQDLYYNTHHTFISERAVYVVIFNLVSIVKSPTFVSNRLQFWIDSLMQHADDPTIILAGTHKNAVSHGVVQQVEKVLRNNLDISNIVLNGGSCYFAIDNANSENHGLDDLSQLRNIIEITARGLKHVSQDYPIKWRGFLDFITGHRQQSTMFPLIEVSELQTVMHEFRIYSTKELLEMLQFFHKSGEIFYDSIDTCLRQYVAPNNQIIIDIMQSLVSLPASVKAKFHTQCEQFIETGALNYLLLRSIVTSRLDVSDENVIKAIVRMMQEKDLLCNIKHKEGSKLSEDLYVVPSMLPYNDRLTPKLYFWSKQYYIDFGSVLSDGIYLRLLSRCAMQSKDFETDLKSFTKQGGLFSLGESFRFMLTRMQPCKQQNIVQISVQVVHDDCPLEVLKYLCFMLDMLRCRDFPNLQFKAGPLCSQKEPHQGCPYNGMFHVLDISAELTYTGEEATRPGYCIKKQCNGRPIVIPLAEFVQRSEETIRVDDNDLYCLVQLLTPDDLKKFFIALGLERQDVIKGEISANSNDIDVKALSVLQRWKVRSGDLATRSAIIDALETCNNIEGRDDLIEVWRTKDGRTCNPVTLHTDEPEVDVYLSCSRSDKLWVQEHITKLLTDRPYFYSVYMNHTNCTTDRIAMHMNYRQIQRSRIFLSVHCSRNHLSDESRRLNYEQEIARKNNVPILAVCSDCHKMADKKDMFDVDYISLPILDDKTAMDRFHKKLVEMIRRLL